MVYPLIALVSEINCIFIDPLYQGLSLDFPTFISAFTLIIAIFFGFTSLPNKQKLGKI